MSGYRLSPGPRTPGGSNPKADISSNSDKGVEANIQVVCRLRPLSALEEERHMESAVKAIDDITACVQNKDILSVFTYDRVCDESTTQAAMYEIVARQTLDEIFSGLNGTILAYGQTGAGKSHTMFGTPQDLGIIPRISHSIFDHIARGSSDVEYTVSVLYMEIYKEQIRDLLDVSPKEYSIHESKEGNYVKGLCHAFVSSASEIDNVLSQGNKHRTKSATNMNAESSRSHAIFQVQLTQQTSGEVKKSNLFLVDLAGSEKVDRTGAVGNSLEEAKKINLSLSVLGLVINSLTDSRSTHIPYRDLKLTRILQESLGGNSRTTLIINCSPAASSVQETISTLRFGSRAKKIRNSVRVNTELSMEQLKARVAYLEKMNKALTDELHVRKVLPQMNLPLMSLPVVLLSPRGTSKIPFPERLIMADEVNRKDEKIAELERQLLELEVTKLRSLHDEDLKLFKLENALHKLNDKVSDVELINDNLRKHLLISEKIIESRDVKIDKLRVLLGEQQEQVKRESLHFENKLRLLKDKLDAHTSRDPDASYDSTIGSFLGDAGVADQFLNSPIRTPVRDLVVQFDGGSEHSPISPKMGLNLRIVKPLRGGVPTESESLPA